MERRSSFELRPYNAEEVLELRQRVDELFQNSDLETIRLLTQFLMQIRQDRGEEYER